VNTFEINSLSLSVLIHHGHQQRSIIDYQITKGVLAGYFHTMWSFIPSDQRLFQR